MTGERTAPYLPGAVDVMAVGNLPNELPRDASRYFGEQLIKFVLGDILKGGSAVIDKASIIINGKLNTPYEYMREYAESGNLHADESIILNSTVSTRP